MATSDESAKLYQACFEMARTTKWSRKPTDTDEIAALAKSFSEIAKERAEYGTELGIDIPLVTRAVCYLGQAHATPPLGDDTQWFSYMLDAVLEIARPNSALNGEGRAFLRDMLHGIGTFIDDEDG
jgi:hypothetical protein